MKEHIDVSIVMPAYQAEAYIEQAIRSVLAQTVTNWELLVIDDCSKDGTRRIAEQIALEDDRVRLLPNEQNMGTARSRNRGLDLCRGEYVAFLDSDDVWYPDKLEKQLALAKKEQADIVYGSYAIINERGEPHCADFIVPPKTDLESMLAKNVIGCSTTLLKRSSIALRRFTVDFYHEDYVYWLQLLQSGMKAVGVVDVVVAYRVSEYSRSSNKLASAVRRWHIYRRYLKCSFWRSSWYLSRYALAGVKKYKKIK